MAHVGLHKSAAEAALAVSDVEHDTSADNFAGVLDQPPTLFGYLCVLEDSALHLAYLVLLCCIAISLTSGLNSKWWVLQVLTMEAEGAIMARTLRSVV